MQLFFGPSDKQLFGVFHAPAERDRKPAVLLCNPFGVEAIRAHRVFRVLANQLALQGHPVLRFDYFGTGDSAGTCPEFSLTSGTQDIMMAHQELLDISGATRVVWLGLRLGAGLALTSTQLKPRSLAGLVLWDPVVSGADYQQALREAHLETLAGTLEASEKAVSRMVADTDLNAEALGFEIGAQTQAQFQTFTPPDFQSRPCRQAVIVGEEQSAPLTALCEKLETAGTRVTIKSDPAEQTWNSDAALNAFTVPMQTIKLLVEKIGMMK